MTSTQHTPGPWRIVLSNRLLIKTTVPDNTGWYNVVVYNAGMPSDPIDQANARLIAAAPDLLGALNKMVSATAAWDGTAKTFNAILAAEEKARTAITKAQRQS